GEFQLAEGLLDLSPEAVALLALREVELGGELGEPLGLDGIEIIVVTLDDLLLVRGIIGHRPASRICVALPGGRPGPARRARTVSPAPIRTQPAVGGQAGRLPGTSGCGAAAPGCPGCCIGQPGAAAPHTRTRKHQPVRLSAGVPRPGARPHMPNARVAD